MDPSRKPCEKQNNDPSTCDCWQCLAAHPRTQPHSRTLARLGAAVAQIPHRDAKPEPRTRNALLAPMNRKERRRAEAVVSCLAKKTISKRKKRAA